MFSYGQFCPVAKACEVLTERWTLLIVRELLCGSTRFGEVRRGVPQVSTALLSKRLRQLHDSGVIRRSGTGQQTRYEVTEAGWELYPIVEALGAWGQRWVHSDYGPNELDSSLLMWDIRRFVQPGNLGDGRLTIEFQLTVEDSTDRYWLVVDEHGIDLCMVDPGHDIDLYVTGSLRALTEVWMGDRTMRNALDADELVLHGATPIARRFPEWLGQHPVLAPIERPQPNNPRPPPLAEAPSAG